MLLVPIYIHLKTISDLVAVRPAIFEIQRGHVMNLLERTILAEPAGIKGYVGVLHPQHTLSGLLVQKEHPIVLSHVLDKHEAVVILRWSDCEFHVDMRYNQPRFFVQQGNIEGLTEKACFPLVW